MKKKILKKIKELKRQREESEKEKLRPSNYNIGWENGYDDALEIMEEFVEDLE